MRHSVCFLDSQNLLALADIPELEHNGLQQFFYLVLLESFHLEGNYFTIRVTTGEYAKGNEIAASLRNRLGQSCELTGFIFNTGGHSQCFLARAHQFQ